MMSIDFHLLLEHFSPALRNHLWQSTVFGAVIVVINLLLRKNGARIRYWLWLAASLKFFVPFSFLMALGDSMLARGVQQSGRSGIINVIQEVATPFVSTGMGDIAPTDVQPAVAAGMAWSHIVSALMIVWLVGFLTVVLLWLRSWIQVAQVVRENEFLGEGREVETLRRMCSRKWPGLRVSSSKTLQQPGVYGMFRPILIWPQAVSERIDDAQMRAIFAHELCHVRCFDNLCATLHMLVEAVFWFHPMVWWLGRKLEEERERACDEEVLTLNHAPKVYAESILKVCELCVTSSADCRIGVCSRPICSIATCQNIRPAANFSMSDGTSVRDAHSISSLVTPRKLNEEDAICISASKKQLSVLQTRINKRSGADRRMTTMPAVYRNQGVATLPIRSTS